MTNNNNNWISLTLPDEIRKALYEAILYIQENIKTIVNDKVEYMPMDFHDIHLTLAYCGEHLRHLKKEQVEQLNNIISDFGSKVHKLKFEKYILFPPYKENLVVALFVSNKFLDSAINKLRQDLVALGSKATSFGGVPIEPERNFVPHITLGKIKYMKSDYIKQCNLDCIPKISEKDGEEIKTNGCYLSGKPL